MPDHLILDWPTERICILRLNRPEAYNALNRKLTEELRSAVADLPSSDARVMILTAEGKGFCAGADLKERKLMSDDEKYAHNRALNALADGIAALPICTVVALNGTAMGGGVEMSLACDIRFAAAGIGLGLTEARIGAIPGAGGTQRLPRLIGTARALEMMYSGEPISSEQAERWGLVNATVPADRLMDHTMAFAEVVARRSRRTARHLKTAVYTGLERDLASGLEIERQAIVEVLASDDYREGLAAFAERREPEFG